MLEGLEISEKWLSDITINQYNTFRIDSEHYRKSYKRIITIIQKNAVKNLEELIIQPVVTGHTPSMKNEEYYNGNIKFIKTDNLRENNINTPFTHFLSEKGNEELKQTQLQKNDIITTIIGATYEIVGRTTMINELDLPANINQNIALIRPNSSLINAIYLNVYLNTYYGRQMLYYHSRQTEQVNLNCREVERILVPLFSILPLELEKIYEKSSKNKIESQSLYSQAEELLLEELGLKDWQPSAENINEKSFSESFLSTGRLDAEYYQPKYEKIIDKIKDKDYKRLGSIVTIAKSIEPGSDAYQEEGIPFVRVSNLTKFGLTQPDIHLDKEEYLDIIRPKKDTILLSKDGSVGIAYKVEEDLNSITSGAILHLQIKNKEVFPDYLTLVLNSFIVKMQSERDAGGSIIQHWKPSEIEAVLVPILDDTIQQKISSLVQESFKLKKQSEHLLEVAKRAVEIAIEQSEEVAMEYINKHSK